MININFINKSKYKFKYKIIYKKIVKITNKILKINGKTELSIIIINNFQMKEISKKYRNKNSYTDVLSFPTNYKKLKEQIGYNMFGDIFFS
jgi:ssRNA-specific RNase YbeY (16S rRNA maturation enzyme)